MEGAEGSHPREQIVFKRLPVGHSLVVHIDFGKLPEILKDFETQYERSQWHTILSPEGNRVRYPTVESGSKVSREYKRNAMNTNVTLS